MPPWKYYLHLLLSTRFIFELDHAIGTLLFLHPAIRTICPPTLDTLSIFACESSEKTTIFQSLLDSRFGNLMNDINCFNLSKFLFALIRSETTALSNFELSSTTSYAKSVRVPCATQFHCSTRLCICFCSSGVRRLLYSFARPGSILMPCRYTYFP